MVADVPYRQVRAAYDETTVRVYQAFSPAITAPAVAAQRFVAPFKRERMTWVKPSFLWMMYRSGWATKSGQERILAVTMARAGFDQALREACLSHFEPDVHADHEAWRRALAAAPVRVQWDPERDLDLEPLAWRAIQVGISGPAVTAYVEEWVRGIEDVTELARDVRHRLDAGDREAARALLPSESAYDVPEEVRRRLGMDLAEQD